MRKKAFGVGVRLNDAESVRRYLKEKKLLRDDLKITKDDECIYFPVVKIPAELRKYKQVIKLFEERKIKPRSYKDIVSLPKKLRVELPTSYDIVGDIILIKLPNDLIKYQQAIGEALLRAHKNIRTVCRIEPVSGELRTRYVVVIAGEHRTVTTHKEYGLSFLVDVQSTYFSPRLASERRRVTSLVQQKETIVDMFAGVGPFSIIIARYAHPKLVYAIDKNTEAVRLAKENVRKNHVLDRVEVIQADAIDIAQVVPEKADRIIMNLPFSALRFFSSALQIAHNNCMIHYYDIAKDEEIQGRIDSLKEIANDCSFELSHFSIRKMKTYAPREFYIGIDITARKRADVA